MGVTVTGLMMRVVAVVLVLFLDLLSVPGGEGTSSCEHPKGYGGESYTEGCLKNTCKASVWRTSMDGSLCCYDRDPYQKNTTITSTVTEDGCVKARIECEEDGDKAMTILHTENHCEDHSTVEQVAEIKQLLIEHFDQTGSGKDSKTNSTEIFAREESPLMFLGPGYNSDGISEVFSLPTKSSGLALANCTIPVFSMPDISNSVGFVHDGYLQICGGHTNYGSSCGWHTFDCYKLKESAWVATTPLMVTRNQAASVMLQDGSVLVSGGDGSSSRLDAHLQSSEVLTASAGWSTAIELPSARQGHCMLQLTTGQLFLHGGDAGSDRFGDTFISTDMSTWVTKASSQDARSGHACVEHGGYIWLGGGSTPMWFGTTEKYDLSTNSWTSGPDLPNYGNYGNDRRN